MKNYTAEVQVPLFRLAPPDILEKEIIKEIQVYANKLFDPQVVALCHEKFSERVTKDAEITSWLKSENAETPWQLATMRLRLGDVLLGCYMASVDEPSTPIGKLRHVNKIQEWAKVMNLDEFECPSEVKEATIKCMEDEDMWKNVKLSSTYEVVSGTTQHITLLPDIIYSFRGMVEKVCAELGIV